MKRHDAEAASLKLAETLGVVGPRGLRRAPRRLLRALARGEPAVLHRPRGPLGARGAGVREHVGLYVGLYVGYVAGFVFAVPSSHDERRFSGRGDGGGLPRPRCRLFGAANLGSNPSAPATHFSRSDAILRLTCFFGQQAVCCRGQHMGPFLGNLWAISWACPKIRTFFSQKPTRRVPPPDTSPPREPRRGLRQAFRRRTCLPPAALPAGSPVAAALLAPAAAPAHHSARRPGSIPS